MLHSARVKEVKEVQISSGKTLFFTTLEIASGELKFEAGKRLEIGSLMLVELKTKSMGSPIQVFPLKKLAQEQILIKANISKEEFNTLPLHNIDSRLICII